MKPYEGVYHELLSFFSRCVKTQHSRTWCPVQLELVAITKAFVALVPLLNGQVIKLYTDNRAAFFILTTEKARLQAQYWRYQDLLAPFNPEIFYIKDDPGDMPSRVGGCPDECKGGCRRSKANKEDKMARTIEEHEVVPATMKPKVAKRRYYSKGHRPQKKKVEDVTMAVARLAKWTGTTNRGSDQPTLKMAIELELDVSPAVQLRVLKEVEYYNVAPIEQQVKAWARTMTQVDDIMFIQRRW